VSVREKVSYRRPTGAILHARTVCRTVCKCVRKRVRECVCVKESESVSVGENGPPTAVPLALYSMTAARTFCVCGRE